MSGGKWGWVVSDELAILANQHDGNFGLNLTKKHCYLLLLAIMFCYHSLILSLACQWRNFQNAIHAINSLNKVI